jgi:hypothetical protein
MPIFDMPIIRKDDYESFRRLLKDDIPDTYEKWVYRQTCTRDEQVLKWEHTEFNDVEIDSNEFARYCRATNSKPTMQSLDRFTQEKSAGKRY